MGTVVHKGIASVSSGANAGELQTDMDWVGGDGKVVLREHTTFFFRGGPGWRSIDRITALQALDRRVAFTDNKEGVLGLRVARFLEMPSKTPQVFTDAAGRATTVKAVDNTGVTGMYLTSEGKTGDAVWGTRGRWCVLTGQGEKEAVSIAILDHPSNPGFPTYWHARGYGLFAANPLGQKDLSGGKETLNFALEPGQAAELKLLASGAEPLAQHVGERQVEHPGERRLEGPLAQGDREVVLLALVVDAPGSPGSRSGKGIGMWLASLCHASKRLHLTFLRSGSAA